MRYRTGRHDSTDDRRYRIRTVRVRLDSIVRGKRDETENVFWCLGGISHYDAEFENGLGRGDAGDYRKSGSLLTRHLVWLRFRRRGGLRYVLETAESEQRVGPNGSCHDKR